MARGKRGASASRGSRGARGVRGNRGGRTGQITPQGRERATPGISFIPFIGASTGFTLADEARQTSQHDHSFWGAGSNLRQKPVKFVSAGTSEPLKLLDLLLEENEPKQKEPSRSGSPDSPALNLTTDKEREPVVENSHDKTDSETELIGPEELEVAIQDQEVSADQPAFFFDVKGDQSQGKPSNVPIYIPERPSSRSSSSSDEVILFKGRDTRKNAPDSSTHINMAQMRAEIQVVEEQIVACQNAAPAQSLQVNPGKKKKNNRHKKKPEATSNDDDDAILADYIANMRENGDADDIMDYLRGNQRDLGGEDYFIPDESSNDEGPQEPSEVEKMKSISDVDTDANGPANGNEDSSEDGSESELDEETMAKLIAEHNLIANQAETVGNPLDDSDSSSDDEGNGKQGNGNDDFDLMDWERPSLRRKKGKGAKAQINFNVSDSELEQKLQAAWNNDRMKKSERKKEREQLRALGMLGHKTNPDDLRVKYPEGMDMEQVADEFRTFLLGSDETLILPPMDNHARKMIHELANKFKIKSKSTGKADQRRPTLSRTKRTLPYVESTFDQMINRINRRYFPRLDNKGKRSQRAPAVRANHTAATYRDGEIIGGAAPELGTENRGRAMLEKMGWSSGTALGSTNNKGILQPVTQTMKRSKAGLG